MGRDRTLGGRLVAGAIGAVVGLALDRVVGEPPDRAHPVALAGAGLERLEHHSYRDHRLAGVLHVAVAVAVAGGTGAVVQRRLGRVAGTAVAVWVSAAPTMLGRLASVVATALEAGDLDQARVSVGALVGRDVSLLDESGVARAAVESVAENTVDAATATLVWAMIGGAPAVLIHRVVNTLDAMVGHRSDRYRHFGWAAARLDDGLNWVPARLTAVTVAAVAGVDARRAGGEAGSARGARAVLVTVRRDGPQHPSPNGGMVETAFAAALGRSLGGINRYGDVVEDRGRLGDGPPATVETIGAAVGLLHRVVWTLAGTCLAGALVVRTCRLPGSRVRRIGA